MDENGVIALVRKYLPDARVCVWDTNVAASTKIAMQTIDVSSRALEVLNDKEMAAVVLHEVAHIVSFQKGEAAGGEGMKWTQHESPMFYLITSGLYDKEGVSNSDVQAAYRKLANIGLHNG